MAIHEKLTDLYMAFEGSSPEEIDREEIDKINDVQIVIEQMIAYLKRRGKLSGAK